MQGLKNILDGILKKTPGFEHRSKELEVHQQWQAAVGERIAKHCWPVRFFPDGVLLVASESSSWIHQLRFLEEQILEKLEKQLKDKRVKGLRFQLGLKQST